MLIPNVRIIINTEINMKIAYLISAYTNPIQLSNLITKLNNNNSFFLIHIDKKVDIIPFYDFSINHKKVQLLDKRIFVQWGIWSSIISKSDVRGYDFIKNRF